MFQNRSIRTGSLPAFCLLAGSPHVFHRSETMSHAFTFRWMGLTRPQRGFTCVRPIGLSLACGSGESELLDIAAPASYPAVTSDALGVGNRLEHWPEAVLPAHSLDATSCRTSESPLISGIRHLVVSGIVVSSMVDIYWIRVNQHGGRVLSVSSSSAIGRPFCLERAIPQNFPRACHPSHFQAHSEY